MLAQGRWDEGERGSSWRRWKSVSSCRLVIAMWGSPVLVYAESSPPAPCGDSSGAVAAASACLL